ncbi:MFS transporter [Streptomyces megasporus]|uniref:MFS transporter n=1 Tax=Streptomyces megasporus TaxID=44060 RepID=UPI000691216C|nr:MFS transporter [Streptomyces megasporus]
MTETKHGSGYRGERGNRVFAILWGGQLVSLLGSSAASFALSLTVYSVTKDALALALVTAAGMFGSIYLAPFAGALADHFPRRTVIISCDIALAVAALLLAWTTTLGVGSRLPLVIGLVFVTGALGACLSVTLSASVRQIRSETNLTRVNGLTSLLENLPVVAGPLMGAAVYSVASPALVFVVDAVTFLVSAVAARTVRWEDPATRPKRPFRPFAGAAAGLRVIFADARLRFVQLSFAGINFCNGLGMASVTAYVISSSAAESASWNLALFNTAGSVGLIVGSSLILAVGDRIDRRIVICAAIVAGAVLGRMSLVLSVFPILWAVSAVVRNCTAQMTNAPLTAIWQERIPQDVQGSVFGARRLLGQGLYPLAVVLGGFLADSAFTGGGSPLGTVAEAGVSAGGIATVIVVAACGEALIGLLLLLTPHLRGLAKPPEPPDSPVPSSEPPRDEVRKG